MYYRWVLYLHIGSALAMLGLHGTSMVVLYRIRRERNREKIHALLTLSGETAVPLYVSLLLIVVSGVLAGLYLESFSDWWIWLAILLLVGTVGYMTAVAKPYFAKIKGACEMRPSGVPRVSDEELEELLSSSLAHKITAVGAGALLVILYLMIFKPGVG
jgi:hypothetical protein